MVSLRGLRRARHSVHNGSFQQTMAEEADGIQDSVSQDWTEQCEATEGIKERFGLQDALNYLIGEKLFHFVQAAETRPEFAAEVPNFLREIRRIFTAKEICSYLDDLERTRYLSPSDPEEDALDDADDELEGDDLGHPVLGVEELLRFASIKEMLQAGN